MYLYRIYTENKNEDQLMNLVSQFFHGYTLYHAMGYWVGSSEPSLIFEIIGGPSDAISCEKICEQIKIINHQESVLLTTQSLENIIFV